MHGFLKSGDTITILVETPLKDTPMKFYFELASLKADWNYLSEQNEDLGA